MLGAGLSDNNLPFFEQSRHPNTNSTNGWKFSDQLSRCWKREPPFALPPVLPANFEKVIRQMHFTNGKTDRPLVIKKCKQIFQEVMVTAKELSFVDKGWEDKHIVDLAAA